MMGLDTRCLLCQSESMFPWVGLSSGRGEMASRSMEGGSARAADRPMGVEPRKWRKQMAQGRNSTRRRQRDGIGHGMRSLRGWKLNFRIVRTRPSGWKASSCRTG
jgi:hypothetical protein